MRIKEIHQILQKLKNGKVTQNDIARAIGTSRANVSKLFKNNSYINDEKIKKIEDYFEITLSGDNDFIEVEYYPDTVTDWENGKYFMSKKHIKCKFPSTFFEAKKGAKYIMCHANDYSMSPTILSGDIVIIELTDEFINNKTYGFLYKGLFYIKRLSININQIILLSDDKNYPPQYIEEKELKNFELLGRVVYVGRTQI